MDTTFYKSFGYSIVLLGSALSFVSAFTPQYVIGYDLQLGVWFVGLFPYMVYSIAVVFYEKILTIVYGIGLITVHCIMVINVRFIKGGPYTDDLLYYGPIILAVALIPLLILALRMPYR